MKIIFCRVLLPLLLSIPSTASAATGDIDNDGLRDEVETNTGIFVTASDTGTNPNTADSDGDSLPDGMELNLGTNPVDVTSKVKRPNIIFIMVDDLGYGDVGCFWQNQRTGTQKFATPGLDAMATEGAMLSHHYTAAPVCAPARGSLFQGRHQGSSDVRDSQFDKPLPNNHTMASTLKSAGYHTVHIGKNGLAGNLNASAMTGTGSRNIPAHPMARGFDRFFGYFTHGAAWQHYPQNGTSLEKAFIYNDYQQVTGANIDLFTTDAWTAYAKKTIVDETRDHPTRPFFIYLAYDTPHALLQFPPTKDYPTGKGLTGGIQWTGAPSYANTATNDVTKIDNIANRHSSVNDAWPDYAKRHVSMIRRLDDSVADLLQTLKDLQIDDNTLVVFTSDNGPHQEGGYRPDYFQSYANLEGTKRDMWEGGLRVPTLAWWPGKIVATSQVRNVPAISTPAAHWDWLATCADLAKNPVPSSSDGDSLVPALTGGSMQRKEDYLYFEFFNNDYTAAYADFRNHASNPQQQMQAIRMGDFMGVRTAINTSTDDFKIYNAVTDPAEAANLAGTRSDLQARMKYLGLAARRKGAGVTRPYDSANIPAVTASPVTKGLAFKSYEGYWPWLPEFRDLIPAATGLCPNIDVALRSRDKDVGLSFTGYISVPTAGAYTFSLNSNNSTSLWIHDGLVIDNDFTFTAIRTSDSVFLEAGLHPIRLFYRHQSGTPVLSLKYSGPGIALQPVPNSALFTDGPTPVFALQADTAVTKMNTSVLIDALANDSCNYPFSLLSTGDASSGTTQITAGKVLYNPASGFLGSATFPYSVSGGATTAASSITAHVLFDDETWIPLNEGSGTTAQAISEARVETGTLAGTTVPTGSWIPGKSGTCLTFDGVGDQVTFPGMVLPTGKAPRTFAFWVRTSATSTSEYQTLFSYGGSSSSGERLTIRLDNVIGSTTPHRLRLQVTGGSIVGTQQINDGLWHHLAVVLSDRNLNGYLNIDETQLYVDGVLDPIRSVTPTNISTTTGFTPTLGGSSHASNHNFTGDIDDVRIFPRALSANEISILAPRGSLLLPEDGDADGDGASNLQEHIAGTDPQDVHSIFEISSFTSSGGNCLLTWLGHAGRVYQIEESTDLSQWQAVPNSTPLVGTEGPMQDTVAAPLDGEKKRFYRVRVELQN